MKAEEYQVDFFTGSGAVFTMHTKPTYQSALAFAEGCMVRDERIQGYRLSAVYSDFTTELIWERGAK